MTIIRDLSIELRAKFTDMDEISEHGVSRCLDAEYLYMTIVHLMEAGLVAHVALLILSFLALPPK